MAYQQNIIVTVPGNTRFYIVLAKPTSDDGVPPALTPSNPAALGFAASSPTVQELRELMQLKRELTQLYQQQQPEISREPLQKQPQN